MNVFPDLKLRDLIRLIAVVDCNLSVSSAAIQLGVAQSAVSRSLNDLERTCEQQLFERKGRRLLRQTAFCLDLVVAARDISQRMSNLNTSAARSSKDPMSGVLRLGATHLQMRYVMPAVLARMSSEHPGVRIQIKQDLPQHLVDMVLARQIDACICTEHIAQNPGCMTIEAYSWNRILIAKPGHPLLARKTVSLRALADYPLITYIHGITGRRAFDVAFAQAQLVPNVVISAADSDVIKAFVRHGHGAGVIAEIAYEPKKDRDLKSVSLSKLFPRMHTRIAYRTDAQIAEALLPFADIFCNESKRMLKQKVA